MNKEDRKRLEEIIEAGKEGYCLTEYDSNWLISQLKAEAAEVEQLRIDVRDWKGLADRTATAIVEYGAMRERAEDKCAEAEAERDKLRELLRELREALEKYGKRGHYYCDDSWYSCPKAEEGCANGDAGEECNCGADKVNAEVDTILWRRSHER